MPSPMMLIWSFRSLTSRTGPRLTPRRIGTAPAWSRTAIEANSASSGSPMNVTAAPSPVSRMMRSRAGTCSSALARTLLNACFSSSCSATGFLEYSTMSRKSTLQTSVRPELSIRLLRRYACGAGAATSLFYAHAGLRPSVGGDEEDARAVAGGGEHHAFRHAELHFARREVRHQHHQPALERGRSVSRLDAGEDRARRAAGVERQLDELVSPLDELGAHDAGQAQIQLVELVDRD